MGGQGRQTAYDGRERRDEILVRICDPAGRPRGTGFVADHHGTVLTSHEAVDGLTRLMLRAPGGPTCAVTAADVTPLPGLDLALVRTDGLGLAPLPIAVRDVVETGTYVRIAAGGWREARVLGAADVTYAPGGGAHLLGGALELAIGTAGRDALRPGGGAAGGPVLDSATGTVIAVLGTALHTEHGTAGFAVPLRKGDGPLGELLARNAATVPAYGPDLNLAGILELTAASVGLDRLPTTVAPVERVDVVRELAAFAAFTEGQAAVLGLVGAPGSGRTTELAALADRRARGPEPAPTLWLRGADLRDTDASVEDATRRALERAGRIVAASHAEEALPSAVLPGEYGGELGDITPERLTRLALSDGRPLLLLLDSPEQMPPALAHRLDEWTEATADWLRTTGTRLVVACREEYWETVGAGFAHSARPAFEDEAVEADCGGLGAAALRDGTGRGGGGDKPRCEPPPDRTPPDTPPRIRLGDLREEEARQARARYGIPEGTLAEPDARHPLTLRLLSEVRAALPDAPDGRVDRHDVLSAHLDLMRLRVAERLAAENGLRGTAVRRLAAQVSGQVHEAARRCLGPGQGQLDRASFESVFPWGPAPGRRLGGTTGWASAVLTEGLLVPAGDGYRFAHEELADWIQGTHLDLDAALHALVHRGRGQDRASTREPKGADTPDGDLTPHGTPCPTVPRHRIGPVVHALLHLAREEGPLELAHRLEELLLAVDALLPDRPAPYRDSVWWAVHLVTETLLCVPDALAHLGLLRLLTEWIVLWRAQGRGVPGEFGPEFWEALPLPEEERLDLLRRLVVADPPTGEGPRYLDAVSRLLAVDPAAVQPHLTRWFADDRPLAATPDATVATAAQALLHTHRRRALDDLAEALVDSAHRRGDELLCVLAEEEPSAVCRAVDRWAHDERPARRVAALTYALRAVPHVRTEADRELIRYVALALLARPADVTLHGGALALLVRDTRARPRHLPQALERFVAGDPHLPASALVPALATHADQVLDAFRLRLRSLRAGSDEVLRTLADVTTPVLARQVAALIREVVELRPEAAGRVAAYVDRRLEHGPATREVLFPLVAGLLAGGPAQVRAAFAGVLAVPDTPASGGLRRELLDLLLASERDPAVLEAVLRAAVRGTSRGGDGETIHGGDEGVDGGAICDGGGGSAFRELVRRTGLLLVRTPEGATRFDRGLVDLARHVPGFAVQVSGWLSGSPAEWAAVVGPSARRMIENLAGVRVPA
ncbi:trypsin-like peptidase domain-containing protein [Streptomyces acidicola]|uniref:trypsin-like peptidase domain-containing protein n=1 Tax=Streptomyces acidicola TaxID=2596892 RepID=UPI0037A26549